MICMSLSHRFVLLVSSRVGVVGPQRFCHLSNLSVHLVQEPKVRLMSNVILVRRCVMTHIVMQGCASLSLRRPYAALSALCWSVPCEMLRQSVFPIWRACAFHSSVSARPFLPSPEASRLQSPLITPKSPLNAASADKSCIRCHSC